MDSRKAKNFPLKGKNVQPNPNVVIIRVKRKKKPLSKADNVKIPKQKEIVKPVRNSNFTAVNTSYLAETSTFYECLLSAMKYLTVSELLNVAKSNKLFSRISSDPVLWETVRMKNSRVCDWTGFAYTLIKQNTKVLDLRKMIVSRNAEQLSEMWNSFLRVIPLIKSLEVIYLGACEAEIVEKLAAICPYIKVLNALHIKSGVLSFNGISKLNNIRELTLRAAVSSSISTRSFQYFTGYDLLTKLSITGVNSLSISVLQTAIGLKNLTTLELGSCDKFPSADAARYIRDLKTLSILRFEELNGYDQTFEVIKAIGSLNNLRRLELVNYKVNHGFDDVIFNLRNLTQLFIIPIYVDQAASTNQIMISGLGSLKNTLKCFVWGMTKELLKMTDLFIQCYYSDTWKNCTKNQNIPILKTSSESQEKVRKSLDFIDLPTLEKLLHKMLPQTTIKLMSVSIITSSYKKFPASV